MKNIIQRSLPLNIKYTIIDKVYIPLEHGCGTSCDNCGALIANIATVRSEDNKTFSIGFDCLETLLINNGLLSGNDIEQYEIVKKMIPKVLRFSKSIKETLADNKHAGIIITGMRFEKPTYKSDYYAFYWLQKDQLASRNNDCVKLKEMDILFLVQTLKSIFPKLNIFID